MVMWLLLVGGLQSALSSGGHPDGDVVAPGRSNLAEQRAKVCSAVATPFKLSVTTEPSVCGLLQSSCSDLGKALNCLACSC